MLREEEAGNDWGGRGLPGVDPLVPLQVALVAGGVAAEAAGEVLLPAVHRQVAPQQSLPAEVPAAHLAPVPAAVEEGHVVAQRRLAVEERPAALQHARGLLVHGHHVALQVVLAVRAVAALGAPERLAHGHGLARRRRLRPPRIAQLQLHLAQRRLRRGCGGSGARSLARTSASVSCAYP